MLRAMASLADKTRAALRNTLFINGAFQPAAAAFAVEDPTTGQPLANAGGASPQQVDEAVKAAAAAFKSWRKVPDAERAGWLRKLADEVAARKPHIAAVEALNVGKPLREGEADLDDVIACLRYCAGLAEKGCGVKHIQTDAAALPDPGFAGSHIIYEPVGVVAGILPFNFPAVRRGRGGGGGGTRWSKRAWRRPHYCHWHGKWTYMLRG
jgi:betaine-aldehyde dehydrogenase